MAEGILRSLINKGVAAPEDIAVSELFPVRCEYLKNKYNVSASTDATDSIKAADMVIIAVLPQHVASVAATLKDLVKTGTIVMSIAAGITVAKLEEQLGADKKIVRVMPNTLSQSGNGHSAACVNENVNDADKEFVTTVLDALGQTMYIHENMFGSFTAFSCSGPLWIYQMADALIDAGVYVGFSRQDARNIVFKNILGVGQVLNETGEAPKSRVDEMCSPGGVTIEGFRALQREGFSSSIMTSVCEAVNKANSIK